MDVNAQEIYIPGGNERLWTELKFMCWSLLVRT